MAKLNCVVILGVVAFISTVSALSEADRKAIEAALIPIIVECGSKFKIAKDNVLAAKEVTDIDALNPCFIACCLKKMKTINDNGYFAPEVVKSQNAKYIHDKELVKKLDTVSDTCVPVYDQAVSNGAEGCDRAKLLLGCMKEHKDIFISLFKA
nr:odorant binding protein 9 [Apocheima cinerarius]